MTDLVPGKIYDVSGKNFYGPLIGRFLEYKDQHCQLHGEFMYRGAVFQRIKVSGKESYIFIANPDEQTITERPQP